MIHALAPICDHCGCKIVGHGIEAGASFFCCAYCARRSGVSEVADRAASQLVPARGEWLRIWQYGLAVRCAPMTEAGEVGTDERELLDALRAHDESAFEALIRRHNPALFRAALSITRDRTLAEEVVQDTWAGVVRGLDRFEGRSSLKTWIFRILMNQAKTRSARERRSVPFSSLFDPGPGERSVDPSRFEPADHPLYPRWWAEYPTPWSELPEERLVDKETMAVIAEAIEALPDGQRLVIAMRDIDGWSSSEVCSGLDITETNQRVLLHRARSKVRAALERYFDREREA